MEETPQNPHLKTYIVLGTLVAIAAIIIFFVIMIYGGGPSGKENQEAQNQRIAEEAKRVAEQKALLEKQAAESAAEIQARNIKPPTQAELKQQATQSAKIIQQRNIKPPTQTELDQQAAESDALLKAMQ